MIYLDPNRLRFCFSDLHLELDACKLGLVEKATKLAETEGAAIILLGDIWDIWAGRGISPETFELGSRILSLTELMIPGNHDSGMAGNSNFRITRNVQVSYPEAMVRVGKEMAFLTHGHLFGRWRNLFAMLDVIDDLVLFRKFVRLIKRTSLISSAGRLLNHEDFDHAIVNEARLRGCSKALAGHSHVQSQFSRTGVSYMNCGSLGMSGTFGVWEGANFRTTRVR